MSFQFLPEVIEKAILTSGNKCSYCTGSLCCTYITQLIDKPHTKGDYTHLLWQVSHEHVNIYKDKDGWCLLIKGKCSHLQPSGRCGIYESRPHICRKHKNDYCEFDTPLEEGFDLYFPTYDSLLMYCKNKFKNWDCKKSTTKLKKKNKKVRK